VGEFRKNTGQTISEGGNGDETAGKKRLSVRRKAMTKNGQFFLDKINQMTLFRIRFAVLHCLAYYVCSCNC